MTDAKETIKQGLSSIAESEGKHLYLDRAEIEIMHEKYEKALVDLDAALERDPNYFLALMKAGYCRMHLRKYRLAVEAYQKAETMSPGNSEILENLYRIFRRLGKTKEADHYVKLMKKAPKKTGHVSTLADPEAPHHQ